MLILFFSNLLVGIVSSSRTHHVVRKPCQLPAETMVDHLDHHVKGAICSAKTDDNIVMMAVIDHFSSRVILPLFINTLRMNDRADQHFIVWAIDEVAYYDCLLFHSNSQLCINDVHGFQNSADPVINAIPGIPQKVVWYKPMIALKFLRMGVSIATVDIDIVFFQDPLQFLSNLPVKDFYGSKEQYGDLPPTVNAGFHFLRPTQKGFEFLEKWLAKDHNQWEQTMMQELIGEIGLPGERSSVLDWDFFPNNTLVNHCSDWHVEPDKLFSIEEDFANYVRKNDVAEKVVALHLACVLPRELKEAYMAMMLKVLPQTLDDA